MYKMKRRGGISVPCKSFISFDYKTVGSSSVTFQYKECGGLINTATYSLTPTSGAFVTYVISDSPTGEFCFEEGTLVRISGLANINTLVFGDCLE